MTLRGIVGIFVAISMLVHLWLFFLGIEFLPDYLPRRLLADDGGMGAVIGMPYFITNVLVFAGEFALFVCAVGKDG